MLRIACILLSLVCVIWAPGNALFAEDQPKGSDVPMVIEGGESAPGTVLEPGQSGEAGVKVEEKRGLIKEFNEGFRYSVRLLGWGYYQDVNSKSPLTFGPSQTPNTRVNSSHLYTWQAEGALRPDLSWQNDRVELLVKPRFEVVWEDWTKGPLKGTDDTTGHAFVNEWLPRFRVVDNLFLSYGRENLQWGPSQLISPSNPFIRVNGRNNPYIEVPGTDFARAVWVPSSHWSVSMIANTAEGQEQLFEGFHRSYAAKIDYTGENKYFSLIPQGTETQGAGVGYFGGWNLTDALLVYSEGRVFDDFGQVLGGVSYTLKSGPVFTVEYYHNGRGSTAEPFVQAFPPFGDTFLDEPLLRTNYIFLQFMDTRIKDVFNITLRFADSLDDGSTNTVGILEYDLGSHVRLFFVGSAATGGTNDEFGSIVKYSAFFGTQYTF